jgi:ABC-type transport system involved in multi-copper enzyme maturation permease subunit
MFAECASSTASHDCGVVSLFGSPLGDPTLMFNLGIGVAMYAVPIVLGVPIVASEIEQRTAMISWPLARSRLKWLAWREGALLVIGLVLVGLMAASAEALAHANDPGSDLGFASHGARGISLVVRSTLMLVVAIAVGAVIGRLLPGLLIGIALAVGLSFAVDVLPPYAVASTELTASEMSGHPFTTGHAYRAPDGTPISDDAAEAMMMAAYQEYSPELPPDSVLPIDVSYGIAGSRYLEVLAREAAVLIGATVLVGGVAAMVVARRRPE